MTQQELEENYKNFDDARIVDLAHDPPGLSDLALEILEKEIERRQLEVQIQLQVKEENVKESPFNLNNRIAPTFEDFPIKSENSSHDLSGNAKVFKTSSFSLIKIGLTFIGLGIFVLYVALNFLSFNNLFGPVTACIGFAVIILAVIILRASGKNQITLYPEKVEFQHRKFIPGGEFSIIDLLRILFSSRRTIINKNDIKSINKPTSFFRYSSLHFELKNGIRYEINFLGDAEELEYVHSYISEYLNS